MANMIGCLSVHYVVDKLGLWRMLFYSFNYIVCLNSLGASVYSFHLFCAVEENEIVQAFTPLAALGFGYSMIRFDLVLSCQKGMETKGKPINASLQLIHDYDNSSKMQTSNR